MMVVNKKFAADAMLALVLDVLHKMLRYVWSTAPLQNQNKIYV